MTTGALPNPLRRRATCASVAAPLDRPVVTRSACPAIDTCRRVSRLELREAEGDWPRIERRVPNPKAATKLKNAAQMTALPGESTRVETIVAIEFAASWKPLM